MTLLFVRLLIGTVEIAAMLWAGYGFRAALSCATMKRTWREVSRLFLAHALHALPDPLTPAWADEAVRRDADVTPSERMGIAIMLLLAIIILRVTWWDFGAILLSHADLRGPVGASVTDSAVNITLGIVAIVASLFALWALHGNIPKGDADQYNLFTAPLYPWARIERSTLIRQAVAPEHDRRSRERHRIAQMAAAGQALARRVEKGEGSDPETIRMAAEMIQRE